MKNLPCAFPHVFHLLYAFSVSALTTSFTVFDVETTGLAPLAGDRIVEIAGVRIEGGEIRHERKFFSLVNPQREMSWEARRVNRIEDKDLIHAPTIDTVLPQFLEFSKDSILIAHNAEFDMSFLHAEKEMCWGYIDIQECLCTLCLSRRVHPHEYRHTLDAVAGRLQIPLPTIGRHRALPDVLLTAEVFLRLVQLAQVRSLDELREKAMPAVGAGQKSKIVTWQSE